MDKLNDELFEEKVKNNNLLSENSHLYKMVEELNKKNNIQNNNKIINNSSNNSNEIINLYRQIFELQEKLKRFPFVLEKGEKLISVILLFFLLLIKVYIIQ